MEQYSTLDIRRIFRKSFLSECGLFFCWAILVFILLFHGYTKPIDYVLIYLCLFFSEVYHILVCKRVSKNKKERVLSVILVGIVLFFEILILICGIGNDSELYARFGHFLIRIMGTVAAGAFLLCTFMKRSKTGLIISASRASFVVLSFSAYIFSVLHDGSFMMSDRQWWPKYLLLGGGIVSIGIMGSVLSSMKNDDCDKKRRLL